MEVVEGLLLDGIDAEARGAAVGGEDQDVALALADEAGTALAVLELAIPGAQVALQAAVGQSVPPAGGMTRFRRLQGAHGRGSFHLWTA